MTLEVRIPISPRPAWINRVRLIAASVREWYPDAEIRVYVGTPEFPGMTALEDVCSRCSATAIRWIYGDYFNRWANTRAEYLSTMMARYKPPFHGSHILMLDADVLPVRPFPELFDGFEGISGVMAHHSPYGAAGWDRLFHDFGLPPPLHIHEYSGWGIMENREAERYGPAYFNSGVVFGPHQCFERLSEHYFEAIEFIKANISDVYWADQVGLAMGIWSAGIPVRTLPARFNFPNRATFDAAKPEEVADLRFAHLMDTSVIHRDRDFESDEAIRALCARADLTGTNEVARAAIARLLPLA